MYETALYLLFIFNNVDGNVITALSVGETNVIASLKDYPEQKAILKEQTAVLKKNSEPQKCFLLCAVMIIVMKLQGFTKDFLSINSMIFFPEHA